MTKRKRFWKRPWQSNSRDQYGDSSSAASPSASVEEGGKGTHSMSERSSKWGPWLPENVSSQKAQSAQPFRLQPANRGASLWAHWSSEVRASQPEYQTHSSNSWESHSSGWERSKWSTPTARNLVGSDYDTDSEWHVRAMRYGDGWAHDPT